VGRGRADPIAAPALVAPVASAIHTFRLTLAYDGTAYAGWQAQPPPAQAIQTILSAAAQSLCGPDVRVTGASRTDAGVHALRQTVSLVTATPRPLSAILGGLNANLPRDIRVTDVREASAAFNARRSARGKRYAYVIDTDRVPSPLHSRYAWHVPAALDAGAMRRALGPLRGVHDFSAFRASAGSDRDPRCVVRALHVLRRKSRVAVLISADRFLHHMVRVVVGSVVDVGRGARPPEWLASVLTSRDRRLAGPTAPPHGLFLVRVMY
jgi:tRNA pseudouridine38-40 synthase